MKCTIKPWCFLAFAAMNLRTHITSLVDLPPLYAACDAERQSSTLSFINEEYFSDKVQQWSQIHATNSMLDFLTFILLECLKNMLLYIWLIFSFALSGAYLTISVRILSSPTALLLSALCAVLSTSYFLIGILRDLGSPIKDDISWFSL